jgi:hypothetical protein
VRARRRAGPLTSRLIRAVRRTFGLAFPPDSGGPASPSLPVAGVGSLSLPIAAIPGSRLVPVRLPPAAVVLGQPLRVLLVPAPHASLALRIAAVLPRAIAAELRHGPLLPHFVQRFKSSEAGVEPTIWLRDHPSRYDHSAPSWHVVRPSARRAGGAPVPSSKAAAGRARCCCHAKAAARPTMTFPYRGVLRHETLSTTCCRS